MQEVETAAMPNGHMDTMRGGQHSGHTLQEANHLGSFSKSSARKVTEADLSRAQETAQMLLDHERCSEEQAAHFLLVLMSAVLDASTGVEQMTLLVPSTTSPDFNSIPHSGMSEVMTKVRALMSKLGDIFFMPLELATNSEENSADDKPEEDAETADVWAAGSLLYYVLSGRTLWAPHPSHQCLHMVVREEGFVDLFTEPWPSISPEARHLLARMLRAEPSKRASAAEVIGHGWVQDQLSSSTAAQNTSIPNGIKANGEKSHSGGHMPKPGSLTADMALNGDLLPPTVRQQPKSGGFALKGVGKKPRATASGEMRVFGEKEKSQRGASWRRGSTDFEVFSAALSSADSSSNTRQDLNDTASSELHNLTPTSIISAPWKVSLLAGDDDDCVHEAVSESPSFSRLERSFSGGSVVEKGEEEQEPRPRPVSFTEEGDQDSSTSNTGGFTATQKAHPVLKSSLKSSLKGPNANRDTDCTDSENDCPGLGDGTASGDESELQKLRAKRRAERVGSVRFSTLPARGYSKPPEGGGEKDEGEVELETKPETNSQRSIRDLFPMEDREKGREDALTTPSKVAPAPLTPTREGLKKEPERRGIMRITSATAADAFLRKFKNKDKDSGYGSFKESTGRDLDGPIVKSGKSGSTTDATGGSKSKKPMLGSLRSLMKRSNSENRQQVTEEAEEEISSDYAAALAVASRRVERELLNSVRPNRRPLPIPTPKAADIIPSQATVGTPPVHSEKPLLPLTPTGPEKCSSTTESASVTPGMGSQPAEEGSKEADPNTVEVDELVALVEVGDHQVGNLLEDFSAILVREQEEASKNGGHPEVVLPPISFLEDTAEDEEEKERQSMIVDNMGRRLLQGPMTVAHPKRRHGRSSHVFC